MQKKILIILALLFLIPATLPASPIQERQVRINLFQLTFEASMANISRLFGVKIDILGNMADLPQRKFSLHLEQATFEQAIKEAMRKANVKSYALVFDQKNKTARVLILRAGPTDNISSKVRPDSFFEDEMNPLTQEQIYLLTQLDQGPSKEDQQPLTPEQMERLKEQSSGMEAEMQEGMKPLSPEQMERLKNQSSGMEAEMQEGMKPLSPEQMLQLHEQSAEPEAERENNYQPLTKEEILLLQEQEEHP